MAGPVQTAGAAPAALRRRASALQAIRGFFRRRGVLEVDTPLLGAASQDPDIASLEVPGAASDGAPRYLQSSPEYALKRLLAAGSGDLYQLGPVFRAAEHGRWHDPEFTLLEWYRVDQDLEALMEEVADLVAEVLGRRAPVRVVAYRDAFDEALGLDPLAASDEAIRNRVEAELAGTDPARWSRQECLDLLFTHRVAPGLGRDQWTFVEAFPAAQAALAELGDDPRTARRFELFIEGLELANGYRELLDAATQRRRFEQEQEQRRQRGLPVHDLDEGFLAALEAGLPACSGVALGVDRLLAVAHGARSLDEVRPFRTG